MAKWQKNITLLTAALLLTLMLALFPGCQAKEAKLTHLKVVSLPYLSFAAFYIPQEEGYFTEQGLEVEFVKFTSVVQSLPLLSQGDLDVAAGSISASLFNAVTQNINLRIVAGKECNTTTPGVSDSGLVVRKDLYDSGEIDTIAKVKGRKVALPAIGAIHHFDLSNILESSGLTLADVEVIKLSPQECITAFANGAIELAVLGTPYLSQAESLGYTVVLEYANSLMPGFQQGFVIFGPSLLEKDPETGKKFIVAYLKGVRQLAEGLTERNVEILMKYTGLDRETIIQTGVNPIYPDGRINIEDILVFQDWLYDNKFVDQKLTPDQLIDTRFVDYANRVLDQ
jgi:NitT/TauT family transport system substrate-binding protein